MKPTAFLQLKIDGHRLDGLVSRVSIWLVGLVVLLASACMGDLTPQGGWSSPITDGQYIYVASKDGQLLRVAPSTEAVDDRWGLDFSSKKTYGAPLINENVVYATGYNCRGKDCEAEVLAIPLEAGSSSGRAIYQIKSEIVGSPVMHGNTLIFGTSKIGDLDESSQGYLLGIEVKINEQPAEGNSPGKRTVIGRELWKFGVGGAVWSTPTIVGDTVYFGAMDGFVRALDLSTFDPDDLSRKPPEEIWRFHTGGAVTARPVVSEDRLFIGDFDGDFYALDLHVRRSDPEGNQILPGKEWIYKSDSWFWASALVDDGSVYASNLAGEIFKLDVESGNPEWSNPDPIDGQIVAAPILIDIPEGRALAVPSGNKDVWVIDTLTGQAFQQFPTKAGVKSTPLLVDELIFVYTLDDELIWYTVDGRSRVGCVRVQDGGRCSS